MKFLLTSLSYPEIDDPTWPAKKLLKRYRAQRVQEHAFVDDPDEADAILVVESVGEMFGEDIHRRVLRSHPWIDRYPQKLLHVDRSETPLPWLPGMYSCLPADRFDPRRCRAIGFPEPTNHRVEAFAAFGHQRPTLLCSFRGARMPGVRTLLLDEARFDSDFEIIETEFGKQWAYGTSDTYRDSYARSIINSKFVLCPRGWATSTYRMYEVMELGRIPVVLSDQWIAPSGPDWDRCIVRVPEADYKSLPERLHKLEPQWDSMARHARTTWQDWFQPNAHARRILDWAADLMKQDRPDELAVRQAWRRQEVAARVLVSHGRQIAKSAPEPTAL